MSLKILGVRWRWWAVGVAAITGIGGGVAFWSAKGGSALLPSLETSAAAGDTPVPASSEAVPVRVTLPRAGGIERICEQPGTVDSFHWADIYAKASGFLAEQHVDIGSSVKAGEVLARLSVPEYEKQVIRDEARLRHANAVVQQSEARIKTAEAEARAAEASINLAKVMVRAKKSYRDYREKQLNRIKALAAEKAVDARLVDEQEDFYLSAFEAENAAKEQVNASQEKFLAAKAKITQAQADLEESRADVGVAEADLAKSQVLLSYTVIKSPYTGIVTRRTFHAGDFIKSADQGGIIPMLTVEGTDLMRIVIQVPDRDVPYLTVGDPVTFVVDALGHQKFKGAIARMGKVEDPATRLMRAEVDFHSTDTNPERRLCRGMYGRATIILETGAKNAFRVPSAAIISRSEEGKAVVRIVRDGKAHLATVTIGEDNGTEIEVLTGLKADDSVIVRANSPIVEGTAVTTTR